MAQINTESDVVIKDTLIMLEGRIGVRIYCVYVLCFNRSMLKRYSLLTATLMAGFSIMTAVSPARAQDRSLWLYNGQSTTVEGYFLAGEYIYGACDDDCLDLDLFLYDANGVLMYEDTEMDAVPMVAAPFEGSFSVEVSMPNCSHPEGCEVWVSSDHGF